ncbi:MAG: ribonuclease HII [Ignavibacteria bacterium]|nr:ribonuclease HII [Ignavibacteria bacterium]
MKTFQKIEKEFFKKGFELIAGVDEAGRGPLAGPVVAAAVVFDTNISIDGINDSKKLSEKDRIELEKEIKSKALAYSVQVVSVELINQLNILRASLLAMKNAVEELSILPQIVLVDGNFPINISIENKPIKKGDAKCFSIAAASILAKNYRDRLMISYSEIYPEYKFHKNKGYPTKEHIEAILKYGPCEIHRKKFLRKIYEREFIQQQIEF